MQECESRVQRCKNDCTSEPCVSEYSLIVTPMSEVFSNVGVKFQVYGREKVGFPVYGR